MPRPREPITVIVPSEPTPANNRQFQRQTVIALDTPIVDTRITATPEALDTRQYTIQAVNRARADVRVRVPMLVIISTTDDGPPGGVQTVTIVDGTLLSTFSPNQCFLILADATGKITLDVTVTGAATRFVRALPLGIPTGPIGQQWT
jgi:hypothetical protein